MILATQKIANRCPNILIPGECFRQQGIIQNYDNVRELGNPLEVFKTTELIPMRVIQITACRVGETLP